MALNTTLALRLLKKLHSVWTFMLDLKLRTNCLGPGFLQASDV